MRKRQTPIDSNGKKSGRQKESLVGKDKNLIPELKNVPVNYFRERVSKSESPLGRIFLKERPEIPLEYTDEVTFKNNPLLATPKTYSYFFIEYNNQNFIGLLSNLKSFSVVKTLSPVTLKNFSEMLGSSARNIKGIDEDSYKNGIFYHPTYVNDSGYPLEIRYAEIAILRQKTPGRLDDVPLGYPSFDSTPDGVINIFGPQPSAPYPDFISSTGATFSVGVSAGGTVQFKDTTTKTPTTSAATGWYWEFGLSASPTGSTAQNPLVLYNFSGSYTVTLTASNATGSATKTKINFVIVN